MAATPEGILLLMSGILMGERVDRAKEGLLRALEMHMGLIPKAPAAQNLWLCLGSFAS